MNFPSHVKIVEVGPRDGLQSFALDRPSLQIPVDVKVRYIDMLSDAGLPEIEAGAFVNPKYVPKMAGSDQVFQRIHRKPGVLYTGLVPNKRGMESAIASGVDKIAVFTAASTEFNRRNINATIAESIERFQDILPLAAQHQIPVRGYISMAFVCPFEGRKTPEEVFAVVKQLVDLGITDISLGDTTGKGTPDMVKALLDRLLKDYPSEYFGMHFHDTFGNAIENAKASLEYGIAIYDSSAGGIGGCPHSPGATGNVATEKLIELFDGLGIYTGADLQKVRLAAQYIQAELAKL